MLCRLFFRFISKLKLILLILISLNLKFNLKNKSATELKRGRRNQLSPRREIRQKPPLKQCITADKPPYQRVSSESRQAHSRHIPSFPIAIP